MFTVSGRPHVANSLLGNKRCEGRRDSVPLPSCPHAMSHHDGWAAHNLNRQHSADLT